MPSPNWNYVDVNCVKCNKIGSVRIDQFNLKNKEWKCRSCARSGKKMKMKNPSPKHDLTKQGAYKSYYRAKRRVAKNHKGAYEHVQFRFTSFKQWFDELGPRPDGMTVDRIDPNGHYEPGNVRWATHKEQCRNRRNNILVEYNGETMCLMAAAKASGLDYGTLTRRLKAGCPASHLFIKGRWRYKNGKLAEIKLK